MAGSKSDYFENELLDWACGNASDIGTPNTAYCALFTVAPTDSTAGTEVTGGSYAREDVSSSFGAAAAGAIANDTAITFTTATASWGTVVAFAIMDAVSGGNILYWGDVTPNKSVGDGDTAEFAIGDIDITED